MTSVAGVLHNRKGVRICCSHAIGRALRALSDVIV